jgi:hypothetical protein
MPYLQEFGLVLNDNAFNLVEFASGEAIIGGQENRIEPELGLIAGALIWICGGSWRSLLKK